jgi:CsoR family transcriptional regulator, copper-sensing transcriptional repressor
MEKHVATHLTPALMARLKTTEGHLRGIGRMLAAGAYCIDIIKQVQATQRALDKWNYLVLEEHLNGCVTEAMRGEREDERERVVGELMALFRRTRVPSKESSAAGRAAWISRIEARVRDVQTMVEANAPSIDLIRATEAIKADLDAFSGAVLADHLNGCVTTAIRGERAEERARVLRELLQVFDARVTLDV